MMKLLIICLFSFALLIPAVLSDPLDADDRMQFADGLYSRELYELAAAEYSGIIESTPAYTNLAAVYYRLADCFRYLGDTSKAERNYARVFKDYPDGEYGFKAGVKRADIFIKQKRFDEGAELYRMVLARNPPEPIGSACNYFLADTLSALGKTNEAEKAYSIVAEKFNNSDYHPFALIRLAEIAAQRGESPAAVLKYYRAASTNNIAPGIAAEALYQMGRIEYAERNFEASSVAFESLAKQFPSDPRAKASKIDAAWAEYSAGFTAKALNAAQEALKSSGPDDMSGWIYLKANCERALGNFKDAITSYGLIIPKGEGRAYMYIYERALCYFARGDYKSALNDLKGIESSKEIREDVLWLSGRASWESGDKDSAAQYFNKLNKEFPEGRFTAQAIFRVAGIQAERKEYRSAAALYAELAKRFPGEPLAVRGLLAEGAEWIKAGEPEKAISAWDTIIKSHSSSEQVQDALLSKAVAQINLKKQEDAGRTIEQFIKLYPASVKIGEAWFWKGVILAQNGDNKGAEGSFSKALNLSLPDDLQCRAKAYRALSIYRVGDEKRAADALLELKDSRELAYAGRNIFVWLTSYRLLEKDSKSALNAGAKLLSLSTVPLEQQEAHCLIGRAYIAAGQPQKAIESYTAASKTGPDSLFKAEAYLALAEADFGASNLDSAETLFNGASRLSQGDDGIAIRARSYMGLGRLFEKKEDYPRASRFFMSVAVLFDDAILVPDALASAARCFEKQGLQKEAQESLAELRARYPDRAGTEADGK